MASDRRVPESEHELRLEGIGLVLGGGLLLAAIVGAFLFGRWVERRVRPPLPSGPGGAGPLSQMVPVERRAEDIDATDGLTVFDAAGGRQATEPRREVATKATEVIPPPAAVAEPDVLVPLQPDAADAPFFVQVIALRDERAAAGAVEELTRGGYQVRLFTEREGTSSLYKVRVGGFRAETEARAVALKLRETGYPGAFVRPPE